MQGNQDNSVIQKESARIKNDLAVIENELAGIESGLTVNVSKLARIDSDLNGKESELARIESDLKGIESDLKGKESALKGKESDLEGIESELESIEENRVNSQKLSTNQKEELQKQNKKLQDQIKKLQNKKTNLLEQIKGQQNQIKRLQKQITDKRGNKESVSDRRPESNSDFSKEDLISVIKSYLLDDIGEKAHQEVEEPSKFSCFDNKSKTVSFDKEYTPEGIKLLTWTEWQHETRSAVVFQKLSLLGYRWHLPKNTSDFSGADFLFRKYVLKSDDGKEVLEVNNGSDQISSNGKLELPKIARILLVHKRIAGSAEEQEIFSAFVISVLKDKYTWIDIRYVASAEEAYQRQRDEYFDVILICPIKEEDNSQGNGLYSKVSYTTLYSTLAEQHKLPNTNNYFKIGYIKDEDRLLITYDNKEEKSKENKEKFFKDCITFDDINSLKQWMNPPDDKTQPDNNFGEQELQELQELKLKKLITYYRVLPYDIFFALLKKANPHLPDRFNLWVYLKNGKLHYSTEPKSTSNAIFFSPALHQTKNLDSLLKQVSDKKTYSPEDNIDKLYTWSKKGKPEKTIIVVKPESSRNENDNLIAAATPLTGVSAIGHEHAIQVLIDKVKALLDGPFDQVVLKTVYQDYMDDDNDNPVKTIHWPELQAQSHHRARCLRSREQTRTLWNTGKTALESLTPKMMGNFINKMNDEEKKQASPSPKKQQNLTLEELTHKVLESNNEKATLPKYTPNIIISLGSKFPQEDQKGKVYRTHQPVFHKEYFRDDVKKVWESLYTSVFGNKPEAVQENALIGENTTFQSNNKAAEGDSKYQPKSNSEEPFGWVEINVRHYLRECVAFHLGGNEYLSPAKVGDQFTGNYTQMLEEFSSWLWVIDEVAKAWHKKVLLKLPFRGDLLHFLNEIIFFYNYNCKEQLYGIQGITLINAFKSAISENQAKVPFSPAWYGMTNAWGDAADKKWKYQMSGEMLNASRNELLYAVVKAICETDMELHISGGVVSQDDIAFLQKMVREFDSKKTPIIQIGTWGLIDLNLSKSTLDSSCAKDAASDGNGRPTINESECMGCQKCLSFCPHGAISIDNNKAKIDYSICKKCKQCIGKCNNISLSKSLVPVDVETVQYSWTTVTSLDDKEASEWPLFITRDYKYDSKMNCKAIVADSCTSCGKCITGNYCRQHAITWEKGNKATINPLICNRCTICTINCNNIIIRKIKYSKAIQPRIAFWLHDLCNGCGKCSRTFYCDSFLDRRGLDGPPMMDTRNCTGCGLCVQTCPQGAIQMFEPKHYTILLGEDTDLMTWRQFLTAEHIPHLVYTEQQLKDTLLYFKGKCWLFNKEKETGGNINEEKIDWKEAKEIAKEIQYDEMIRWRCEDDKCTEMYGKDKDGYKDERDATVINKFLDQLKQEELLKLWYSLALSDPGQILKESPVILVKGESARVCTISTTISTQKTSPKDIAFEIKFDDNELKQTPESIRACKTLEEIRIDVAKRLSNLREEKR